MNFSKSSNFSSIFSILSIFLLSCLLFSFTLNSVSAGPSAINKDNAADYASRPVPVKTNPNPLSEDADENEFNSYPESTHELFERHGLGFVTDSLSSFVTLFDKSTHFFSKLNSIETFEILNRFVSAFALSFTNTFGSVATSKDAPSGSLSINQVKDLLDKQESNLKSLLIKDDRILSSEWSSFIGKIHILFDSLKELYILAFNNGLSLNWWIISILVVACSKIPKDLFDHATFEEFLGLPGTLHSTLHEALNSLMSSDSAPMIKLALSTFTNYNRQKRREQRESEL